MNCKRCITKSATQCEGWEGRPETRYFIKRWGGEGGGREKKTAMHEGRRGDPHNKGGKGNLLGAIPALEEKNPSLSEKIFL